MRGGQHDVTSEGFVSTKPEVDMPERLVLADPIAGRIYARSSAVFACTVTDDRSGRAWVHVVGELDVATAPQLERTLRRAERHAPLLVLDLRGLTFMDCSGVHLVVDAALRARHAARQLIVGRGPSAIECVLVLTGASDVVQTVDLDSGEPALQGPPSPHQRSLRRMQDSR
jgi:anti-anti-sigma factor